jgi:hypothetical protein
MLKRTIAFEDFNGNKQEDTFYFNLSKPELLEMEAEYPGGFANHMQTIVAAENEKELIAEFKKIILLAYGIKSSDGLRFEKSPELSAAFTQHPAYSELFIELATDADKASAFVNGILPKDLQGNQDKPLSPPAPPSTASSPSQ